MFKHLYNEAVIRFRIQSTGPLLIKAGQTGVDPTRPDMEFVRTWHGGTEVVYLPGSSLKGVLRAHCERIVRTVVADEQSRRYACDPLGKHSCSERLKAGAPRQWPTARKYEESCFICQLFGNMAVAGRLRTSDAYPTGPVRLEQRDGVAIDRVFGSVAVGPFQFETATDGEFSTQITIRNFTTAHLGLLGLALRDLMRGRVNLGFAKSRGLGSVTLAFDEVTVRYPACTLRANGMSLLGDATPLVQASELAGVGVFPGTAAYGVHPDDKVTLPPGAQLQIDEWQEVVLTLQESAVEDLWRAAVPKWRARMGLPTAGLQP